ncbi:MFS general substrate transporter [Cylindrobasidium torrendii FP15055 ss-10]|uniref:MFS general substrate transporter n=1 Tax=Cylindrobasidium torrendii FP15055 ss-10 TaxID=1314674 RepID=A0A0D7BVQ4_9AGAR|nr:MFS general substrate transporter [Cylindrobasidium torrendii FP15055 ss-10]
MSDSAGRLEFSLIERSGRELNKENVSVEAASVNSKLDGDEALKLVGTERTAEFSSEYNFALRKKLDRTIPPLCAAVYFTQYLDKTSLNYASIMGLPITGQKYNLVSMAFYIGYLVWEFPTVYISQKLRVAKYLGFNILAWGAVLMLHAVGTSFPAFFVLRVLLGMLESCVAPILIQIVTMFYKKDEQGSRISWFYVMNGLTHIFGGFLAYGVSFYDGDLIAPFKIIYILLGGLAIVVGICVLVWLPDSPIHAKFLTEEERIAVLERVRDDQGGTLNKTLKRRQVIEALTDVRTWLVVLSTMLCSLPNGGISNFSNKIVKGFGYTSKETLILSTPYGVFAALMTIFVGWYSDKKGERMVPIIFAILPTIFGAAILIGLNDSGNKGALLFGSYLIGTFGSALAVIYAYNASNTSGHTKKSTVNAMTMATFSIGNIAGSEIFQAKDAPSYIPGKVAVMVIFCVQIGVTFILRWMNIRLNQKKRVALDAEIAKKGWTDADVQKERDRHAFMDLTDLENPYFMYTP